METVFTEVNAQNARANLVLDESGSTIVDASIVEAGQRGIDLSDSMAGRHVKGNTEDQINGPKEAAPRFLTAIMASASWPPQSASASGMGSRAWDPR